MIRLKRSKSPPLTDRLYAKWHVYLILDKQRSLLCLNPALTYATQRATLSPHLTVQNLLESYKPAGWNHRLWRIPRPDVP